MASLANANLPSDDEEDLDYQPSEDDEEAKQSKKKQAAKRLRGAAAGAHADGGDDDAGPPEADAHDAVDIPDSKREAKKAKIDALWSQLSQKAAPPAKQPKAASAGLASLCRPASKKAKPKAEAWMRELGLGSSKPKSSSQAAAAGGEDKKAVAAAALAAAKTAASMTAAQQYGKVVVTETRRFAGKDITVKKEVAADSKEAQKAGAAAPAAAAAQPGEAGAAAAQAGDAAAAAAAGSKKAGLDAVLQSISQPKKVTVLDKSRSDWKDFKTTNEELDEELETYKKSSGTYLEKKDFLQRTELREYEQERDKRLASDMRTRGRL